MRIALPHLAAAAAIAVASAALPAAAGPSPVSFIDAAQFQVSQPPVATLVTLGDMYQVHLAQTLTVEIGGTALGVFLPVYCPTGTLYVVLRDASVGGLAGPAIAKGTVGAPTQPWYLQRNFIEVPFSAPVKVAYGASLAIEVAAKGGECYFAMAPAGSDYPGGSAYYESTGTGGWVALGPSGSYGDDIPFQLRLQP